MPTYTLRYRNVPSDAAADNVEAIARRHGGRVAWQRNDAGFSSYALVEGAAESCAAELSRTVGVSLVDGPIIAVAVSPHSPEALPLLESALAGLGAPLAVTRCERANGALEIEWNPAGAAAASVMKLVDLELARLACGRTTTLLSPLPLEVWTRIAAEGLQAPEIAPDRVLEALLEHRRVAS